MKRKLAIALTAGLATVALTACGPETTGTGESDPSETPSASEEPTESEESESETEDPEAESEAGTDGDLTPPGTELPIGDTATVTTEEGAVVKVTIDEIEEGTSAQLEEQNIEADASKLTPFFVRVSAEVVSGNADNFDPAVDVRGLIGDQAASQFIDFNEFTPCQGDSVDPGSQPGDTAESCTLQIAEKGQTVDGASYHAEDTDYDKYDGQPVIWRS